MTTLRHAFFLAASVVPFLEYVKAQTSSFPTCTQANWTFNTKGQSPCFVAIALENVCAGGPFYIDTIHPGGRYNGPIVAAANLCGLHGINLVHQALGSFDVMAAEIQSEEAPDSSSGPAPTGISISHTFTLTVATPTKSTTATATGFITTPPKGSSSKEHTIIIPILASLLVALA
ncbi:hypothetical protein BU17DRAFT_63578 [Hysterangium stoloniferum]|nr:hypothetical protein BU17DRAFT_63578 [Hysterangium stoloniferum]